MSLPRGQAPIKHCRLRGSSLQGLRSLMRNLPSLLFRGELLLYFERDCLGIYLVSTGGFTEDLRRVGA